MVEQITRYELRNRYLFQGKLSMQTAFHIGGGKATLSSSNDPVVLTPAGEPFIPGSSFKGALRSTVEKLVPGLSNEKHQYSSCGLIELNDAELKAHPEACSTVRQRAIVEELRNSQNQTKEKQDSIRQKTLENLCNTCQLFGSPYAAARIAINDLYLSKKEWSGIVEVRDGVAIDRDSERAKDRLKYDYEVVPASAAFVLEMTLENASKEDLQLLSVGLSEFMHGFGAIGGKRSRGLGACILEELKVFSLDLNEVDLKQRNKDLRDYLLNRKFPKEMTGEDFLKQQIDLIF